jgi:hypothetical protein
MEKSNKKTWKNVSLRHFVPLKVVPLIEVLLYWERLGGVTVCILAGDRNHEEASNMCSAAATGGRHTFGLTNGGSNALNTQVPIRLALRQLVEVYGPAVHEDIKCCHIHVSSRNRRIGRYQTAIRLF